MKRVSFVFSVLIVLLLPSVARAELLCANGVPDHELSRPVETFFGIGNNPVKATACAMAKADALSKSACSSLGTTCLQTYPLAEGGQFTQDVSFDPDLCNCNFMAGTWNCNVEVEYECLCCYIP